MKKKFRTKFTKRETSTKINTEEKFKRKQKHKTANKKIYIHQDLGCCFCSSIKFLVNSLMIWMEILMVDIGLLRHFFVKNFPSKISRIGVEDVVVDKESENVFKI